MAARDPRHKEKRPALGKHVPYDAGNSPAHRTPAQRAMANALQARSADFQGKGGRFEVNAAAVVVNSKPIIIDLKGALSQRGNHAEIQALINLLISQGKKPPPGSKCEGEAAKQFIRRNIGVLQSLGQLTLFTERAPCTACRPFLNELIDDGVQLSVYYAIPIDRANQPEDLTLGMVLPQAMDRLNGMAPAPPLLRRCINGSIPADGRIEIPGEDYSRPTKVTFYQDSPFDYAKEMGLSGCRMLIPLVEGKAIPVYIPKAVEQCITTFPESTTIKDYVLDFAKVIKLEKKRESEQKGIASIIERILEVSNYNIAEPAKSTVAKKLTDALFNNLHSLEGRPQDQGSVKEAIEEVIQSIPKEAKFEGLRKFFADNKEKLLEEIVKGLGEAPPPPSPPVFPPPVQPPGAARGRGNAPASVPGSHLRVSTPSPPPRRASAPPSEITLREEDIRVILDQQTHTKFKHEELTIRQILEDLKELGEAGINSNSNPENIRVKVLENQRSLTRDLDPRDHDTFIEAIALKLISKAQEIQTRNIRPDLGVGSRGLSGTFAARPGAGGSGDSSKPGPEAGDLPPQLPQSQSPQLPPAPSTAGSGRTPEIKFEKKEITEIVSRIIDVKLKDVTKIEIGLFADGIYQNLGDKALNTKNIREAINKACQESGIEAFKKLSNNQKQKIIEALTAAATAKIPLAAAAEPVLHHPPKPPPPPAPSAAVEAPSEVGADRGLIPKEEMGQSREQRPVQQAKLSDQSQAQQSQQEPPENSMVVAYHMQKEKTQKLKDIAEKGQSSVQPQSTSEKPENFPGKR